MTIAPAGAPDPDEPTGDAGTRPDPDPDRSSGALRRRLGRSSQIALRKAGDTTRQATRSALRSASKLPAALPPDVREQIGESVRRLSKVRSVKGAKAALLKEAERLFLNVTPLLAAAPLPLSGWGARLAAGSASGAGAVVEQAEELADLVSWGGALPSAPAAAAAVFTAWVLQLWIAVSARVRQLRTAGRQVDPDLIGLELARAYLGEPGIGKGDDLAAVARGVARRAVQGWLMGLVPGAGIAVDAYSAQRTVARILREPVTAHPPAPTVPSKPVRPPIPVDPPNSADSPPAAGGNHVENGR
ncbi:MAG: hypothetical protein ACRDZ8_19140 [Acidimicrobiales bacterium]